MGCVKGNLMQLKLPKNTQQRLISVLIINLVFASLLSVFCFLDVKTFATLYLIQEKNQNLFLSKICKKLFYRSASDVPIFTSCYFSSNVTIEHSCSPTWQKVWQNDEHDTDPGQTPALAPTQVCGLRGEGAKREVLRSSPSTLHNRITLIVLLVTSLLRVFNPQRQVEMSHRAPSAVIFGLVVC